MKRKIAIQIYGHLRTFKSTYKSVHINLIRCNPNIDFDIFLCTWDSSEPNKSKMKYVEIERVIKYYKPKGYEILSDSSPKYILHKNSSLTKNLMVVNTNYCMKLVNRLRESYERENDLNYDYIITTRPDIIFHQKLNLTPLIENKVRGELCGHFDNDLFATYIISDYYGQINSYKDYICGVDLFSIKSPKVAGYIKSWDLENPKFKDLYPEFALSNIYKKEGVVINLIGYEKDRGYSIQRHRNFIMKVINSSAFQLLLSFLFYCLFPFLVLSKKFKQKTLFNQHLLEPKKIKRLLEFLK